MLPEKTQVIYDGYVGYVNFTDPSYITICINKFPNQPNRDVCILVYPNDWHKIQLLNGNQNENRDYD